jgi:uracil-DNA glycosylase family 4
MSTSEVKMLDRTQLDLWFGTKGPSNANIIIVGESWGSEEARAQRPFVGSSGTELNRILAHAGLNPLDILFTNVVAAQPQGNETWRFFEPKAIDRSSIHQGHLLSQLATTLSGLSHLLQDQKSLLSQMVGLLQKNSKRGPLQE